MRVMLRSIACVSVLLLAAAPLAAGEWSAAEKEAWGNVEAYWQLWAKGDVDGFLGYMSDDYVGWSNDAPLPSGKESSRKWMSFWASSNTILVYEITPVAVRVHGDFAVAHYYYSYAYRDGEGQVKDAQGRWTDILVKSGDRWVLLADHGGGTGGE